MKSFVLQKSANNEIRIGWQDLPYPKRKQKDTESVKKQEYYAKQVALAETDTVDTEFGGCVIDNVNGNLFLCHDGLKQYELRRNAALDIINDFQRSNKRRNDTLRHGYGLDPKVTKFGSYARHTILEGGAIASRGAGSLGKGVEVTLTIPSTSPRAFRTVSRFSGYIVNRLLQAVRRCNHTVEWFYVWELQGRGALHLHMALTGAEQEYLLRLGRKIRKSWYRILEALSTGTGVDCFATGSNGRRNGYRQFLKGNRVAEIEKSLSQYFAKYVSKGVSSGSKPQVAKWYPPARWWGMSRSLLRKVKSERVKVSFVGLSEDAVADLLSAAIGYVGRYNPVRSVRYGFEVSYGGESSAHHLGYGERFIYWLNDEGFSAVGVWLPQLLRFLHYSSGQPVVNGDVTWMAKESVHP